MDATLIGVRMPPELLAALDHFVAARNASMTRPEALRLAFREWAIDRGFLVQSPRDEGKRPEELNAGNDG